ncbi:hypothetical protein J7I79_02555 [Arthrobacter sp. ISL-69]|nr:hypothetical protein [Arthrobacter sp. ISL-69]
MPAAPFAGRKNDAGGAGGNERMTQFLNGDRDVLVLALQDPWLLDQGKLEEALGSLDGSDLDDGCLDVCGWEFGVRVLDVRDDLR